MRIVLRQSIWLSVMCLVFHFGYGQSGSKKDMAEIPDFRVYEVNGEFIMFGELSAITITA